MWYHARTRLKVWVQKRADEPVRNMRLFTSGSMIFIAGMMCIVLAERLMVPSLQQELLAAAGVLIGVIGALRALYGYLAIGLFKLLQYFFSD